MKKKFASELEYLRWFFRAVDFGPAHGDQIEEMNRQFEKEKKKRVPFEYEPVYF